MGYFRSLRLQYFPLKKVDTVFGKLLYMYIPNDSQKSYWECEWKFPPTDTVISISLPGDESGPYDESRAFYKDLISKYEKILSLVRPQLNVVFQEWLNKDLPDNMFSDLKLSGFDLADSRAKPVCWDISFETIGNKWLGITVSFKDEVSEQATVDT